MRTKKNKVYLSQGERRYLQEIVKNGRHSAKKIRRANILLLLDENYPPVKKQTEIAKICYTTDFTVRNVAREYREKGMEALERKERAEPPTAPIVTGEVEAHIIAIACSDPPEGHNKWTLELTAKRLVELKIVPAISKDTVGRALKKRVKASPK